MNEDNKKNSEDIYLDIDFDEEQNNEELRKCKFVNAEIKSVKIKKDKESNMSEFYDTKDKLVAQKIIHKKTGHILEINYNSLGGKESVTEYDKNKILIKATDYYENGQIKLLTDYGPKGSYKSMMYNVDGSRLSFVEKFQDGTAQAIHYDVDNNGTKVMIKFDENKNVIEKGVIK